MFLIEKAIRELKQGVSEMTELTASMVRSVDTALRNRNAEAFNAVIERDHELDSKEKSNDQRAMELLALINPRAGDLRLVFAIIKMDVDLERIGDECKNVARELAGYAGPVPEKLKTLSGSVLKMVENVFSAWENDDAAAARGIIRMDDEIDALEKEILKENGSSLPVAFSAKAFERIADHATNIAEKVIFTAEGKDIRHEKADSTGA